MKFGHLIAKEMAASPAEWGPFWLNYKLLKKKIKSMTSAVKDHSPSDTTPEALSNSRSEVEFFRLMDYEIRRGAQFLSLAEGQYVLKTRAVLDGYRTTQHILESPMLGLTGMLSQAATTDMWIRLLHSCVSVYAELLLLNHWMVLSYCGFTKILKKHDRWTGFMTKEKYLRSVMKQHFTSYPRLHGMLRDMEALYCHISKHVQDCPERVAAHARIVAVKEAVASASREFSKYTTQLTSVILGRTGSTARASGGSGAENERAKGNGEAGTGSSLDNAAAAESVRPPTGVMKGTDETNRGDHETSTIKACSRGEGSNESSGSGSVRENSSGPPETKRRKLSKLTISTRVLTSAATAASNRAEIGKLSAELPSTGESMKASEGTTVPAKSDTGSGGNQTAGAAGEAGVVGGSAQNCCGVDCVENSGGDGGGAVSEGGRSQDNAVELLQQFARDGGAANNRGKPPGAARAGDTETDLG